VVDGVITGGLYIGVTSRSSHGSPCVGGASSIVEPSGRRKRNTLGASTSIV
jgi:hypothetical protein